jgi:hypothetical protein
MTKTIDTLIDDIYELLGSDESIALTPELLEAAGADLQNLLKYRMEEERKAPKLRMSALGKPDRQLWYEVNSDVVGEKLSPNTFLKFLYGDLLELVILYLAEESGHAVTAKQAEVELGGVLGHNDAIIDGVVVDVKTASRYGFRKFADGTLEEDDPFGYMEQLAAYCTAHGGLDGAFLAIEKESGKMALLRFSYEHLKQYAIEEVIEHKKEVLASPKTPDRCYKPVPEGASGNMVLGVNCSYCPFKFHCWSDANNGLGLRSFIYSTGPKYFTEVRKEPRVLEVTL